MHTKDLVFVGKVLGKCDRRPRCSRTSGTPVKEDLDGARCGLWQVMGRRHHLTWVSKDREELLGSRMVATEGLWLLLPQVMYLCDASLPCRVSALDYPDPVSYWEAIGNFWAFMPQLFILSRLQLIISYNPHQLTSGEP